MKRTWPLVLAMLAVAATGVRAQSLFGTIGLGLPITPLDARAEALGGIGTGLLGDNASLVNPADDAGTLRRNISAVFQPTSALMSLDGNSDRRGGTSFPLVRLVQPLGPRLVTSLAYAGFMDQTWAIATDGTEDLAGNAVSVHDVVKSRGGLAQARLGVSYYVNPYLAVGAAVGVHTGEVQRTLQRTFPDTTLALQGFSQLKRWRYSGPMAAVGVRIDPLSILRIAGSVTWNGKLNAFGEDPNTSSFNVTLPLEIDGGVGALLARNLEANVGAHWAGWSRAAHDQVDWQRGVPIPAVNAWRVGGGFEWTGIHTSNRSFPIRLGAQEGTLPFQLNGHTPKEWYASLGFGVRLAPSQVGPGALLDASVSRGQRGNTSTTGLAESFWRVTVSLSLFGS